MHTLLNLLILVYPAWGGGLNPEFHVSGLGSADVQAYVAEQAEYVYSLLPARFQEAVRTNHAFQIRIEALNEALELSDFCTDKQVTFAYLERKSQALVLSHQLVLLAANPQTASSATECFHNSAEQTLQAAIVHELAHLYDWERKVSKRKQFRALIAAPRRSFTFGKKTIRNYNLAASPDPYEFKNAREAFATNIEYYVLDSDYACLRPAFSRFLDNEFGVQRKACSSHNNILLHSHLLSDNLNRIRSFAPDDVYEIHYLHASEGSSLASRWGHSMLRFITCAPYRETVGPECLTDYAHHLVLSYRANVADVTINYLSGLLGAYPSQLFLYELPEIIKEYTRLEFRDLISIPLDLSQDEQDLLVLAALERYWNYQGRYYFLTNHCGTETLNHLRLATQKNTRKMRAISPRKLLRSLLKTRWASPSFNQETIDSGAPSPYFFASKKPIYQANFDSLQTAGLLLGVSFDQFLKESEATERMQFFQTYFGQEPFLTFSKEKQHSTLRQLLFLERLMQAREFKALTEELIKAILRDRPAIVDSVQADLKLYHGAPWELIRNDTYGVPNRTQIEAYLANKPLEIPALSTSIDSLIFQDPLFSGFAKRLSALREVEHYLTTLHAQSLKTH